MDRNLEAAQGDIAARRELEDEKNRHLRTLADFDNFRRRMERDAHSTSVQGKKDLIKDLLPVLDNLERAYFQAHDVVLKQGLQLVWREFTGILHRHGLSPVESTGNPFDPDEHEGIGYMENTGFQPGYVAQELRRGYRFGGELLRPAAVRVAQGQVNE